MTTAVELLAPYSFNIVLFRMLGVPKVVSAFRIIKGPHLRGKS